MGGQSRYRAPEGKKAEKLQSRNRPYTGYERYGVPQPGWSDRINDPEIRAAIKKTKGIGRVAAFFVVPLPLIGFIIYAAVSGEMEMSTAFGGGLFVSFVFFICVVAGPNAIMKVWSLINMSRRSVIMMITEEASTEGSWV